MRKVILRSNKERRRLRVRKKVFGTGDRPRMSVYRSNKYIYAQLIDDKLGKTLAAAHGGKKIDSAFKVGEDIAKKAKTKKIGKIVFDKGSYRYHGRVKALADGARKGGLKF